MSNPTKIYATTFKGTIVLKDNLKANTVEQIEKLIRACQLEHIIYYDIKEQVLYVNGAVDNSLEHMEIFLSKISSIVNLEDTTPIKAKGDNPKDIYDLILKDDGLYIQQYTFIPSELVKYDL